jgi:hypothetical protein
VVKLKACCWYLQEAAAIEALIQAGQVRAAQSPSLPGFFFIF